jgi:uncharacterized protein
MQDQQVQTLDVDHGDEPMSNHSPNPYFGDILNARLSRRQTVAGTLGAMVAGMVGTVGLAATAEAKGPGLLPPNATQPPFALKPTLNFDAIPVTRADSATVPAGYEVQTLIPWGTPLTGNLPAYDGVNGNTGTEQEQQVGSHHDGMHYFPFDKDPNGHGLLCVNHEYVDQRVFHVAGPTFVDGRRPTDEVRKEIAAHGVSVAEIRKDERSGQWGLVNGKYNRRVTAGTEMLIQGPVRGSDLVRTRFSPDGTRTRGTINNCAHGYTPWGTYLTCEENWAGYFVNRVQFARIDALLNYFEQTQPGSYPGPQASFVQGDYYARYYPSTNTILGVIDETFDQKITSRVYRQTGTAFTDAGRELIGELEELLAETGVCDLDCALQLPREFARYGVPSTNSRYRWETAASGEDQYIRFDASIKGTDASEDYRNEPNAHGWVVEIDPFSPKSTPVKRTTFGRFAHEGAWLSPPQNGQPLVWYMGDDAQNEYIYKFVSKARYSKVLVEKARKDAKLRRKIAHLYLNHGTLYVARFDEDGSGEWLPLDIEDAGFQAAAAAAGVEFADQADVLVNTRLAADVAGATKMDRPEWGTVHPQTLEAYMALTNNSARSPDDTDAANPRGPNPFGHIIRWREQGNRAWARRFQWDLFALAGDIGAGQALPAENGPALTEDNIFASPDGLWIDQFGTFWIQTDMSGSQQGDGPFGENQMLAADPATGEIKRFLAGPFNQETTGVVSTPDGTSLFVNFQHPGDRSQPGSFTSNWPDSGNVFRHPGDPVPTVNPEGPRPRTATIVITRKDGGVVGR